MTLENPELCILCGEGELPSSVAKAATARYKVLLIGIRGLSSPSIELFDHVWMERLAMGRVISMAAQAGHLLVIGRFRRSIVWRMRFDLAFLRHILPCLRALMGGDDRVSRWFVDTTKKYNIQLLGVRDVASSLLAPKGFLTKRTPTPQDMKDLQEGAELLRGLSAFDVGQAAVVSKGRVVAIEAADGTNSMLEHVKAISASWKSKEKEKTGVLVKMRKVGQEQKIDLPTIGTYTIQKASEAGLVGIALEAEGVVICSAEEVTKAAEEAGLFVYGF